MNFTTKQIQQIIHEELEGTLEERCWDGYERVPGKKKGERGSCRKQTDESVNEEQIDEAAICKKGKDWVDGKTIGGQKVSRGKDGKFNNWSARAAQIASKYCKDPNYGKGRGKDTKKEQMIREEEGGLKKWEKENWTHSDGSPCGAPKGGGDGSDSRCKPASKWAKMSSKEKKADNAKKKRGTDKGKQYVKSNYPVKNESRKRVIEVRVKKKSKMKEAEITDKEKEELEDVTDQLDAAVIAHGNQSKTIKKAIKKEGKKNCGCGQDPCKTYGIQEQVVNEEELEEKKKKPCKPSKGKRFAKRVNGKCRSYGQAGKAKGGGDRIRPGTKKGDAYCARSAKIKKCKNPPCANDLSRKKWKCRGSKSMKEQKKVNKNT